MNYNSIRKHFVSNPQRIVDIEKEYFNIFINGIKKYFLDIQKDFNDASELGEFWKKYAPRQRGNNPTDESYPWGEVGEKVLEGYIYKIALETFPNARFTGIPYGHDTRFVTDKAFVHLDIKVTGPNESPDDIVASPNQVSGDGAFLDEDGVMNTLERIQGPQKVYEFQPELPPFYVIDDNPKITLTFYLKCVYNVIEKGNQPLSYLELVSVPNGLIMFDSLCIVNRKADIKYIGRNRVERRGIFQSGKDGSAHKHARTRIELIPLSILEPWRCVKIYERRGEIVTRRRSEARTESLRQI